MEDPLEEDFFSFEGEFAEMRKRMLALMRQQRGALECPTAVPQGVPDARRERKRAVVPREPAIGLEVSCDPHRVNVVMPIPWAKEEDIKVTASAMELTVDASGPRGFSKTVPLPHRINPSTCEHALKNGLLLISAQRQRRSQQRRVVA
jgi:HSP20 family molecular chaperone IbpA